MPMLSRRALANVPAVPSVPSVPAAEAVPAVPAVPSTPSTPGASIDPQPSVAQALIRVVALAGVEPPTGSD